ncbi:ABC transporter permease [Mariniblastus fucicola]|uniref:ABC-2 family transporter protein n=1 Tax=Mariniblastus fucicola TaxID=980251 RepID=A0A5B9PNI7_9BACT|nr:ABC transporter permease subunit [Mariniblastus fucicola]QEG23823.1 ABC-2 family transporter protein [Mariniblastus fucicola]
MPIHDLGYRPWKGTLGGAFSRTQSIAYAGIKLVGKSRWLKRILIVAWLPVLYWGIAFFFVGQSLEQPVARNLPQQAKELEGAIESATGKQLPSDQSMLQLDRERAANQIERMFKRVPRVRMLADSIRNAEDDVQARNRIWAWLLMCFFRYSQAILILMIVGFVAPSLISQDLRSRAYLLYFSRPIGKLEYIFGKLAVPGAYIMFVSTFPALILYIFAILMSPSADVFWTTWDIPLRIIVSTVVLIVPTASLALMLSSLTEESRYASFAWFATWILGHGAWMAITVGEAIRQHTRASAQSVAESSMVKTWSPLSIYNNLGDVQSWVFGFRKFSEIWPAFTVLTAITIVALLVLYRRVAAPLRA